MGESRLKLTLSLLALIVFEVIATPVAQAAQANPAPDWIPLGPLGLDH